MPVEVDDYILQTAAKFIYGLPSSSILVAPHPPLPYYTTTPFCLPAMPSTRGPINL